MIIMNVDFEDPLLTRKVSKILFDLYQERIKGGKSQK